MFLLLVGLDHHTAPVELREQLAIPASEMRQALREIRAAADASELALLSTCNRVELYAVCERHTMPEALVAALASFHGLPAETFSSAIYVKQGYDAALHLCTTAAGANSLILGEAQIQGQVREAQSQAQLAGTAGPVLHMLFRSALVAGKRARAETAIGTSAVSISHAGVELTRQLLGDLRQVQITLVGSGKMSELAARNLLANGAAHITLINRSLERAQALADEWGGVALPFEQLEDALAASDVVISSTAAPHTVITAQMVERVLERRGGRGLLLIDLAVPRDIEAEAGALPGVHLHDIDDLEGLVGLNRERRAAELAQVLEIVEQETRAFERWMASRAVSPTLEELHAYAERIKRAELERALRRLGPLTEQQRRVVETLAQNIVGKLLHQPTVQLRQQAQQGDGLGTAELLRQLFGLD